jgi:hypothetical protein
MIYTFLQSLKPETGDDSVRGGTEADYGVADPRKDVERDRPRSWALGICGEPDLCWKIGMQRRSRSETGNRLFLLIYN